MVRFSVLFGLTLCACSGAQIRGARIAEPEAEPRGRVLAEYAPSSCSDAIGQSSSLNLRVRIVEGARGRQAWVVRPGYDVMVIDNAFRDREEFVFQAQTESPSGPAVLHDLHVPDDPTATARLAVAREFSEQGGTKGHFKAVVLRPAIVCRLQALAPAGAANATAARAELEPSASVVALSRYRIGDRISVSAESAVLRAKVRQALGDRYYVEYEGAPRSGEWIDRERIVGKLF